MEAIFSALIPAIVESVFGALTEAVGLSDWLRQRLGRDPEKLAFHQALTQALTDSATHYPGRDLRYFAEILRDIGGPLLARTLQPAAPLPTADELTTVWLNHLTVDSLIHYRVEFTQFANHFLDRLQFHLENQQPLQWITQARRQRSSEEAIRRMADVAEQSAINVEALRQEIARLTAALVSVVQTGSGSTVTTGGGAYIGGNVRAQNFAGRDLTIKNYFVAGLPRLVMDYSSRIQDFLLEYLGSKRKKVPFGGRQQHLAELDTWLDDPAAPPYYLMTAEAGRGKSALLCRWLAQLTTRPDLDVIFVPISIRFETATQEVFFAALAARLAKLYDEGEKLKLSATFQEWKADCELYLRRPPPVGKQVVVILDGLDEATGWMPGRGLFSTDPPDGLRVLVTARPRPGESGTSGWATVLGWDDPRLVRTTTLSALDLRGVEEALASMGNPLNKMATQIDTVGELHRLSEGDPLLVRLYVDALLTEGQAVTTLQVEDLYTIRPGLAGYFERWWQDQQEQWRIQGRDPIVEQANLRLLLNAFAAACAPLTLDDLVAIHPDLGDSILVRRLVELVGRWVVGDGKKQGYSYSHSRLGYYFWEQLSKHEQRKWDERFIIWGKQILQELKSGALAPQLAPRYLLQHYGAHLQRVNAPPAHFYALISNGWRKAWEYWDVSYAGFLNDVERARMQARQIHDPTQPRWIEALVQQVKVAFCHASVAALGSNLEPPLLTQLVESGIRTPVQALAIVKLIRNERKQSKVLASLAPHLSQALLGEALATAQMIENVAIRVWALSGLAPYLPENLKKEVLQGILAEVEQPILSQDDLAEILVRLAPHLSEMLKVKALDLILRLENETRQLKTLSRMMPYLTGRLEEKALHVLLAGTNRIIANLSDKEQAQDLSLLMPYLPDQSKAKALQKAQAIKNEFTRAWVLTELLAHLPDKLKEKIVQEVLVWARRVIAIFSRSDDDHWLIRLIENNPDIDKAKILQKILENKSASARLKTLGMLIPHLSHQLKKELRKGLTEGERAILSEHEWNQTLKSLDWYPLHPLRSDKSQEWRLLSAFETLGKLAPYIPNKFKEETWHEVITTAQEIINDEVHTRSLKCLIPHLPDILKTNVLASVQRISDEFDRKEALIRIMPYLPDALKTNALTIAKMFEFTDAQIEALGYMIPYLPSSLKVKALAILQEIPDGVVLGIVKTRLELTSHLPHGLKIKALHSVLEHRQRIRDEGVQIEMFKGIIPFLTEKLKIEMLAHAQTIGNENDRVKVFSYLLPYLSGTVKTKALHSALAAAKTIQDEYSRVVAIINLLPLLPEDLKDNALNAGLVAAQAIKYVSLRAHALTALAPYLSDSIKMNALRQALDATDCIVDEYSDRQAEILTEMAPHLPDELKGEALTLALAISNTYGRMQALCELAPYLSTRLQAKVLAEIRISGNDSQRAEVLCRLAPHLPDTLRVEVFSVVQEIEDEDARVWALGGLFPHLSELLQTRVLEAVYAIRDQKARVQALVELVPYLPEPEHAAVLAEALHTAHSIDDRFERIRALISLVPVLIEPHRTTVLTEAIHATYTLDDESDRADALIDLVPLLPEPNRTVILAKALHTVRILEWESDALIHLIPHLSSELLTEVLHVVCAMSKSTRGDALEKLAPHLSDWAIQQPSRAYAAFADSLPILAARPRPEFLRDLTALMPFILALAGDEAPQAAAGIYQALQEVCGWWP